MIAEDIKAVNAGLGVALLLAAADIKPKPTDLATMHAAREAFARLRMKLQEPRSHDDIAAARQRHNLSI